MGIDRAYYHGWRGALGSPWLGCLGLVRAAFRQLFRKVVFWFGMGLGMLGFLTYFAVIFAVTQFSGAGDGILRALNFNPVPGSGDDNGYLLFMEQQSAIVIIVLALTGSLLVGADFRQGAVAFYLSRRIDRRHYIAAKLLTVSAVVAMLTVLPALVLYVEYGGFTSSFSYWIEEWRIPVSILGYGLVLCVGLSAWLVALSAWLQRMAPIAIAWTSSFLLLRAIAGMMRAQLGSRAWELLDPWRDLRFAARYYLGYYPRPEDADYAPWALLIVTGLTALALAAVYRRVRGVDIVT